jgi:metal transporter CNNM
MSLMYSKDAIGIMSGLTLGLLSLDTMNLEIIIKAGEPNDAKNAKK